jgi:hypothetical protein
MEMMLKQAKAMLKAYLHGSTGYTGSLRDAIDTVLPIVEKYQKIEQIMKKEYLETDMNECLVQRLVEIREVIADGNDD